MQLLDNVARLWQRLRHPYSLPRDIACDLGICAAPLLSIEELIADLVSCRCLPRCFTRSMPRFEAEKCFRAALKKEFFRDCSLFSYAFTTGWVVFSLYFDANGHLRRLSLQCPAGFAVRRCDLPLAETDKKGVYFSHGRVKREVI